DESRLAEIWAEVLGIRKIGPNDSFFDLGGHSLLATQVITRIKEVFQLDLPLTAIFEEPNLGRLAQIIQGQRSEVSRNAPPALVPALRDRPIPASFAQQRLWFIDQLEPGGHMYNSPLSLRIRGSLDPIIVQRALDEIVARHETLRTTFV